VKAIFYCHFGAGDILESREFVKDYIRILGTDENYYAHGKPEYILKDMQEVKFTPVTEGMGIRSPFKVVGDTVYINMWIGRESKYVLPNIGVVVEEHYRMHRDILASMGFRNVLKPNPLDYVPDIDYKAYALEEVIKFISEDSNHFGKRILISNGPVHSSQAFNFDFTPVIELLCDIFPDYSFIVTQRTGLEEKNNLSYTGDIIGQVPGTDLNEISYLSTFCDVHIGRNSGPHVFSQVKKNWMDKNKTSLSFTYGQRASHFVLSDGFPMKKAWSPLTDTDGVFRKICEVIR